MDAIFRNRPRRSLRRWLPTLPPLTPRLRPAVMQPLISQEVRRLLLDGGGAICNKELAALHADLKEEESSSCSDGSSASGSATDEGRKAKKAKKEVQAKKAKKEVQEKKEKKEKKEGADVAMALSDAVAASLAEV